MKLLSFFLLILSFICTLSEALPAGGSQCVPVNEGGGTLRNINGAAVSAFSDRVQIVVAQASVEPSSRHPFGAVFVDIFNQHCLRVRVEIVLPDGRNQVFFVGPFLSRS